MGWIRDRSGIVTARFGGRDRRNVGADRILSHFSVGDNSHGRRRRRLRLDTLKAAANRTARFDAPDSSTTMEHIAMNMQEIEQACASCACRASPTRSPRA